MQITTRIHNIEYDLTDFYHRHPGGKTALSLAAGRDSTVLFESHHPFTSPKRLASLLARYRVSADSPTSSRTASDDEADDVAEDDAKTAILDDLDMDPFDWPASDFAVEMKGAVNAYFQEQSRIRGIPVIQAIKATPAKWAEAVFFGIVFIFAIRHSLTGDPKMLVGLPLAAWFAGISVFHDASHWSMSHRPWVNVVLVYLWPYFSSPFTWTHQHLIGHHVYTNLAKRDPDLVHDSELRREHVDEDWVKPNGEQARWWRLLIHWSLASWAGLGLRNDLFLYLYSSYNGYVPIIPVSKARVAAHFALRFAYHFALFGWPFMVTFSPEYAFHDQVWYKLLFSLLPIIQFSWFFMLNTQLNHLSPNTMEETSRDWYKHQVVTSQNFGNGWKFVHLFSGGLGYQIEHHMFPTVNSCHFPAMADIVEPICKKHGVQYNAHSGYISAAKLYYKHTVRVGKEEARGGNKGYGAKEI